jgi:hypothetical protein
MSELSDYQLGHDIMAQKELLLRSYVNRHAKLTHLSG